LLASQKGEGYLSFPFFVICAVEGRGFRQLFDFYGAS
jgi:hypothetical protein